MGVMSEIFPGMDVGEVDFDGGEAHGGDGVTEGDASMGVSGGIDHDDVELFGGLLDPSDEFAFDIALAEIDFDAEFLGAAGYFLFDFAEGGAAIDTGFSEAEHVQVGAVEEQDLHLIYGKSRVLW